MITTDKFELLDFRTSDKIIKASNTIKKYFSDMAHCVLMLSIQGQCNTIEEAERVAVCIAKRTIIIANLHNKNRMSVTRLHEVL